MQQPIAPLKGVFAHFSYVLHHPEGNERTGDIRSSWVDVTAAAGPILLKLGRATCYCQISYGFLYFLSSL